MDAGAVMLIAMVALPTLPALVNGSVAGAVLAGLVAFGAAATVPFSPFGWAAWLLAWAISWMLGSSREKRRRSERQHRELLAAIAKGQKVEPPR